MRLAKVLATIACVALLSAGLLGSASFARAQDAASTPGDEGASSAPSAATQPDMKTPPSDLGGCWDGESDGSLDDQNYGNGHGWIGIDQKGGKIIGGKHHSYYEFLWDNNAYAYGYFSGKVKGTGFTGTALAGGKCRGTVIGHLGTSNDIVGTYDFKHCGKANFIAMGTFDLPADNAGCNFVTPPTP